MAGQASVEVAGGIYEKLVVFVARLNVAFDTILLGSIGSYPRACAERATLA